MRTENKSITPSEKACLLVSRRRSCVVEIVSKTHDRTGQPVVERGQELNALIRTLCGRTEGVNPRRMSGGD